MGRTNAKKLEIVSDDKKYFRTIYGKKLTKTHQEDEGLRIVTIPRDSFLAFRLKYVSISDISKHSRILLLGGIPQFWFEDQQNKMTKAFSRITSKDLTNFVFFSTLNNYRTVYKTRLGEIQNKDSTDFEITSVNERTTTNDFIYNHNITENETDSIIEHYNTTNNLISLDDFSIEVGRSDPMKEAINYNNESLSTSRYTEGEEPLDININKSSPAQLRSNSPLRRSSSFYSFKNLTKPFRSIQKIDVNQANEKNTHMLNNLDVRHKTKQEVINKNTLSSISFMPVKTRTESLNLLTTLNPQSETLTIDNHEKITDILQCSQNSIAGSFIEEVEEIPLNLDGQAQEKNKIDTHNILKMETMLVMITLSDIKDLITTTTEVETESLITRVSERWKEYVVIARDTKKKDEPIVLQFYKLRKKTKDKNADLLSQNLSHRPSLDILLSRSCLISFSNTLDKTISVKKPRNSFEFSHNIEKVPFARNWKKNSLVKIYLLKLASITSAFEWNEFLQRSLGIKTIPAVLNLAIPETKFSIDLEISNHILRHLRSLQDNEKHQLKIGSFPNGYKIYPHPIVRYLSVVVFETLKKAKLNKKIEEWRLLKNVLSFALRREDRIEWYFGCMDNFLQNVYSLSGLYNLEFRPLSTYPTEVGNARNEQLEEPQPIEGFLIRCTNKYGNELTSFGRLFVKPSYFFTSDNLLLSMPSFRAIPPLPISIDIDDNGYPLNLNELNLSFDNFSEIYQQQSYPLDQREHLPWLNGNYSNSEFNKRDLFSFKCFNRRVTQILKAESVLDMTEVKDFKQGTYIDYVRNKKEYDALFSSVKAYWKEIVSVEEMTNCMINIITNDNLTLRLIAPSTVIAEKWIIYLNKNITYWKLRKKQDIKVMQEIEVNNFRSKTETINENNMEVLEGKKKMAKKNKHTPQVNLNLQNIEGLSLLRPIIQKGFLFEKPKKYSSFLQFYVILIPGFIILYKYFRKSAFKHTALTLGFYQDSIYPIDDCYLHTGDAARLDLINNGFNNNYYSKTPNDLPRLYEDGWFSDEDEGSRCFIIRFGDRNEIKKSKFVEKTVSSSTSNSNNDANFHDNTTVQLPTVNEDGNKVLRYFTDEELDQPFCEESVNISEKCLIFMARSRQERDLWVLSMNNEIDRLKR